MESTTEDSLKKRYMVKLFANIVNGLINIILVAIVPKALGSVAFGQFSYLQQFFSQIIGFFDAGSSMAFFTKLSANHRRNELITFYFIYSFVILVFMTLFVYGVKSVGYAHTMFPNIPDQYLYLGMGLGFLTWLTQIYIKISDAYALTISVELLKITHKIFTVLLLLYFINYLTFDLSSYFHFNYIAAISFILIISLFFIKKEIFTKRLLTLHLEFYSLIKEFTLYSYPIFLFSIVGIGIGLFDIWLLQKMSGSTETGFYNLAYSIAAMCFLFTSAMTPIITREFSKSYANGDIKHIIRLFHRYIPMLYSIAAFFAIFIAFESKNLIYIFTDEKFKDAAFVLVVMAFYPIHQTYGQLTGSLFFATGQTNSYKNIGLFSSLLGLPLTFLFLYILNLGAIGLAWKMVIVQIIAVNIQLYFNGKFLKISIVPFLKHQCYSIVFFTILAFTSTASIFTTDHVLLNFVSSGIIYTLLVILGTLIFPTIFATSKNEIKGLWFKKKGTKS
ncbi:MAG: lipopolysaccharide biosynthesis protein [Sulfuricurvum sp.]